MNRLNIEDFYDWHPEVEMAGTMTSTIDGTKLVRLTARLDFLDKMIDYVVTVRDADGMHCSEYDYLSHAILFFNKEVKGE